MMITVTRIVMTFSTKVSRRYLAIRGIVEDVGGRILETRSKNTTMESRTEIVNVIFSPAIFNYHFLRISKILRNTNLNP